MASLGSSLKLGSGSASSLIKSANTITNEVNAYRDAQAKAAYQLDHSDTAFKTYSDYLTSRINDLQSTGSITNLTKATQLHDELVSAYQSNVSFNIKNTSIAIMDGSATAPTKINQLGNLYQQALGIGDVNLAQSLESQAYSAQQTYEQQLQTAAQNAEMYAKAQGTATGAAENSVATNLENGLKQLNADIGTGGMSKFNTASKAWVDSNKSALMALADAPGISPDAKQAMMKAISSSQPGYQDIISGVTAAIMTAHVTAANMVLPYDPGKASDYNQQAQDIANGNTKIQTLAGSLSAQDIQNWQNNPGMFIPHENTTGGSLQFTFKSAGLMSGESAIAGYKYDQQGNLAADFTGQETGHIVTANEANQINSQLTKFGVSFKPLKAGDNLTNGISVQFSDKSPDWLKGVTGGQKNLVTQLYVTGQGLQFATLDKSGQSHAYLLATDSRGLSGLYQGSNENGQLKFNYQSAKGEYGFNQNSNSVVAPNLQAVGQNIASHAISPGNVFNNIESVFGFKQSAPNTSMAERSGGGFNFTQNGQAISAARYSQITGVPFRTLLQSMANQGDSGAKTALGFVGNDYGYDPTKTTAYQNSGVYNALTWGAGVKAAPSTAPASVLGNGAQLKY